eukprot:3755947-Amphidinium_carterae.1
MSSLHIGLPGLLLMQAPCDGIELHRFRTSHTGTSVVITVVEVVASPQELAYYYCCTGFAHRSSGGSIFARGRDTCRRRSI